MLAPITVDLVVSAGVDRFRRQAQRPSQRADIVTGAGGRRMVKRLRLPALGSVCRTLSSRCQSSSIGIRTQSCIPGRACPRYGPRGARAPRLQSGSSLRPREPGSRQTSVMNPRSSRGTNLRPSAGRSPVGLDWILMAEMGALPCRWPEIGSAGSSAETITEAQRIRLPWAAATSVKTGRACSTQTISRQSATLTVRSSWHLKLCSSSGTASWSTNRARAQAGYCLTIESSDPPRPQ